jgi:branched-chain amino acid transport system substrate-binding protein
MTDRLRVCFGVVALLATASLALTPARAEDTIKLGVLEPFTGPWAKNGNESYVAMEIARDMINEQGGIKGKKDRVRARRCA